MTKIFKHLPFSSPLRATDQELLLTLESQDGTIVDYGQYSKTCANKMQLNKKHIAYKKSELQYQMHTDVVDTEITIMNKDILKHLSDDIEIRQLKEEFITNLHMSELTDDRVKAYFLPQSTYWG